MLPLETPTIFGLFFFPFLADVYGISGPEPTTLWPVVSFPRVPMSLVVTCGVFARYLFVVLAWLVVALAHSAQDNVSVLSLLLEAQQRYFSYRARRV